ncbi:hypothetical protein [Streptomyces sp. NPDC001296]
MASLLGASVPLCCPACDEPMTVPVEQTAADRDSVTVVMDLGPFRAHIAAAHQALEAAGEVL